MPRPIRRPRTAGTSSDAVSTKAVQVADPSPVRKIRKRDFGSEDDEFGFSKVSAIELPAGAPVREPRRSLRRGTPRTSTGSSSSTIGRLRVHRDDDDEDEEGGDDTMSSGRVTSTPISQMPTRRTPARPPAPAPAPTTREPLRAKTNELTNLLPRRPTKKPAKQDQPTRPAKKTVTVEEPEHASEDESDDGARAVGEFGLDEAALARLAAIRATFEEVDAVELEYESLSSQLHSDV
ncbi:hypothetical protein PYCC9005_001299 [Savitreella phatthalungensis]